MVSAKLVTPTLPSPSEVLLPPLSVVVQPQGWWLRVSLSSRAKQDPKVNVDPQDPLDTR